MTFSSNPHVNEAVHRLMHAGGETPYGQARPMTLAEIHRYVLTEFGQAAARTLKIAVH